MRFPVMATGIKGTDTVEYQWDLCSSVAESAFESHIQNVSLRTRSAADVVRFFGVFCFF